MTQIRWALSIAALIAMLVIILLALSWCSERKRVREARAGETVAQGRTQSAVEAINETASLNERADVTDNEVSNAQEAIRQAAPADRDRIARQRLCVLQHRPDCDRLQ